MFSARDEDGTTGDALGSPLDDENITSAASSVTELEGFMVDLVLKGIVKSLTSGIF